MRAFFSPTAYRHGPVGGLLACLYLALATLLIVAAAFEFMGAGSADGSFLWGFAFLATMPLSIGVMVAYSAIETARGVPLADQDGGWGTLVAFVVCALVNALVIWVLFRGRRLRADQSASA
jgi:hypothetical protein